MLYFHILSKCTKSHISHSELNFIIIIVLLLDDTDSVSIATNNTHPHQQRILLLIPRITPHSVPLCGTTVCL